jgi:two-component system chemotaxis sensor kinase CheA
MSVAEAAQILFRGGLSTASGVSDLMGRGVGLNVVRTTAAQLQGEVSLDSQPGKGTSIEIVVPISIESLSVLAVEAGGATVLVPYESVRSCLRLSAKELVDTTQGGALIVEDRAVPFASLEAMMGMHGSHRSTRQSRTALVIQGAGTEAAVSVDRLRGVHNTVVRPLPPLTGPAPLVAGAMIDGLGIPQLVIDPIALVSAVRSNSRQSAPIENASKHRVLVVDDSLTTRMLEQTILETAGYDVDLATSAEEGLEKARSQSYALFLVDVEMPGMNGFELLAIFQADPELRQIPAILVTSRVSSDDQRRGREVGARAHIAKGEFDERHLLKTIGSLVRRKSA